ncbi:MAG: tetratricopeptide repeat protein [Planctomycetota bacterium]
MSEQPGFITTWYSLQTRAGSLLACLALGATVVGSFFALRSLLERYQQQAWVSDGIPWIAFMMVIGVWISVFASNARYLPRSYGFDYSGHIEYFEYLVNNHRFPAANEGWQFYQPPVYYILNAVPLALFDLPPRVDRGVHLVRGIQQAVALAQVLVVFLCLRTIFPNQPGKQLIGLLFAGFLPALIYLAHYVTNEVLAATMASASFLMTFRILNQPRPTGRMYATLGVCLGIGLASKVTVLLIAIVIFTVLAGRLVAQRNFVPQAWLRSIGLPLFLCLLISGWHYGRLWMDFGSPLVGNWDERLGFHWWQEPGYHSAAYYTRFGHVLSMPFFSGMDSLWDSVYATLWGDGMCASALTPQYRPPWNYDVMATGYLLALIPTSLVVLGFVAALGRLVRQPSAEGFLILGTLYGTGFALVLATLRLPFYGQAKAFYILSAMLPFSVAGVWGFEFLTRRLRWLQAALAMILVTWAANVVGAFHIDGNLSQTHVLIGNKLSTRSEFDLSAAAYERALQLDRRSWDAEFGMGSLHNTVGNQPEAERRFLRTIALNPSFSDAYSAIGYIYQSQGKLPEALTFFHKALEIYPDNLAALMSMGDVYLAQKEYTRAENAFREALRIRPASGTAHQRLAVIYQELGDAERSIEQGEYAVELYPNEQLVYLDQVQRLCRFGLDRQAVKLLRNGIQTMQAPTFLMTRLAWILATSPDESVRDGKEARALAEQVLKATSPNNPQALDALAAAWAESGDFTRATNLAERSAAILAAPAQSEERNAVLQRADQYRAGKPFRENRKTNAHGPPQDARPSDG